MKRASFCPGIYAVSNMKSNNQIIVFKRCVCHIYRYFVWRITNFSTYCLPRQDLNATVEPCTPPPPPPARSLKWQAWKLHDETDLKSIGCIFSLIPTTWTMQIVNTKARPLDLCAGKSRSSKILIHGCIKQLFLVPYRWNRGGTIGFLAVCHSVRLSVRQSVRLSVHSVSVHSVFRTFLSRPLSYWLEIWYMDLSWHNTDQVCLWLRLTSFYMSYCPLLNFVFRTFLCHLSTYWVEISYMNLSWYNTGQVCLWSRLTSFYMSYCPLLKFRFPDFSLSSFNILGWNFIYEFVLT